MKIAIVGESLTDLDDGELFSGITGWHLDKLLAAVGISRRECFTTVVFNHPLKGGIRSVMGTKKQGIPARDAIIRGKYVKAEYANELIRLDAQLADVAPNIIIALGPTALWALTGEIGIKAARGVCRLSHAGQKVLATYDPQAVVRQWALRPVVIADLQKAATQSAFPDYIRPERLISVEPSIADLLEYENTYFNDAVKLACDIETKQDQITCIGFSPSPNRAIVIPFFLHSGANYWGTRQEELAAWEIITRWLREYPTVYQNGLFDMGQLWKTYGIPAPLAADDTMLAHHALQPEMLKGLGFLASLYTDEPSWKQMGKGMKHD